MNVIKLTFSIEINASKEKVWHVLFDDATYRDWTSVFHEGSYAKGDWSEGSRMEFRIPEGGGMYALVDKCKIHEFLSIKHQGEITAEGVDKPWEGEISGFENYSLNEINGVTTLIVDLDTIEDYKQMMEDGFNKGLARVKELAEG